MSWPGASLAAPLQFGNAAQQIFLLGASLHRHRLDRVELLAAHQIHPGENALQLTAQPRLDLVAHAGKSARRTTGDTSHVVEEAGLALHGVTPYSAASFLPWHPSS